MKRMSYNSLRGKDKVNTLLIVASRSVSRYTRKDVRPFLNYDYQDKLKPSKELMDDWYKRGISKEEYIRRYFKEHENIDEVMDELTELEKTSEKEVILLCHCGKDKFCHTKLLLEISNKTKL